VRKGESEKANKEYEDFLEEIEHDPEMRKHINLYNAEVCASACSLVLCVGAYPPLLLNAFFLFASKRRGSCRIQLIRKKKPKRKRPKPKLSKKMRFVCSCRLLMRAVLSNC
jgi:hypothetical protein